MYRGYAKHATFIYHTYSLILFNIQSEKWRATPLQYRVKFATLTIADWAGGGHPPMEIFHDFPHIYNSLRA